MAVSDGVTATRFDIETLDTLAIETPNRFPFPIAGCAHWQREPGTDNSLTVSTKLSFSGIYYQLLRYRPQDDYQHPQEVVAFKPKVNSYVHSFSVTQRHAIIFFYPFTVDSMKVLRNNFHGFGATQKVDNYTYIYVIDLQTGGYIETQSDSTYALHHANAYEKEGDIVVDIVKMYYENGPYYVMLENMMNPPETVNASKWFGTELSRYNINVETKKVTKMEFPDNATDSLHYKHFEFPVINEAYRGRFYCIIYGWSEYGYSRTVLIKRNLCVPDESRKWYLEDHYASEMTFVANPNAKSEDDGVLMTIVYDGKKEKSYLLILDAKQLLPINKSYLPHHIPWSAHGMYFPEAKFHHNS